MRQRVCHGEARGSTLRVAGCTGNGVTVERRSSRVILLTKFCALGFGDPSRELGFIRLGRGVSRWTGVPGPNQLPVLLPTDKCHGGIGVGGGLRDRTGGNALDFLNLN